MLPMVMALAGGAVSQSHLLTILGETGGEQSGRAVASVGDVNKDGWGDFAVGSELYSPTNKLYAGRVTLYSGRNGRLLWTKTGIGQRDFLGCSVAGAGDVNKDGHADVVVGARGVDKSAAFDVGSAIVYSGRDGSVLWQWFGDSLSDAFGSSVSGAGDVNKDGYADVAVGAPSDDNNQRGDSGMVRVFSGQTGKPLWEANGDSTFDYLGWSVAGAGDTNNDGNDDVVVGTRQLGGTRTGYARILSGTNGNTLQTFAGTHSGSWLGYSVAGLGDVNKDGRSDVIVGEPKARLNSKAMAGGANVYSGIDGKRLWRVVGSAAGDELGTSVGAAGDINGDGNADFLVGAPLSDLAGMDAGVLLGYSGANGAPLVTVRGSKALVRLGSSCSGGLDMNDDGLPDFVVGSPHDSKNAGLAGKTECYSPRRMPLTSDNQLVSLVKQASQNWAMDAGTKHASKAYFMLGSITGTKPGIKLGNVTLPLQYDPYTDLTIMFPNSPLLSGSLGVLDASGRGTAKFNAVPQLPPALQGTLFWHAYIVFGAGPFDFASNAVPLLLAK